LGAAVRSRLIYLALFALNRPQLHPMRRNFTGSIFVSGQSEKFLCCNFACGFGAFGAGGSYQSLMSNLHKA
jgi:hypothetical protein